MVTNVACQKRKGPAGRGQAALFMPRAPGWADGGVPHEAGRVGGRCNRLGSWGGAASGWVAVAMFMLLQAG